MKLISNILLCIFLQTCLYGQTCEVKVSGNVSNVERKAQEKIPILIVQNDDTLFRLVTDEKGEFTAKLFHEGNYSIFIDDIESQRNSRTKFKIQCDSLQQKEYYFEMSILRLNKCRFDNSIYSDVNETKIFQNFDKEYIKQFMIEYPHVCYRFVQTINPNEKLKIAKRRMKNFRNELINSGFNMNQILFSDKIFVLDLQNVEDKRSRIEGVVHSLDGNCK